MSSIEPKNTPNIYPPYMGKDLIQARQDCTSEDLAANLLDNLHERQIAHVEEAKKAQANEDLELAADEACKSSIFHELIASFITVMNRLGVNLNMNEKIEQWAE